MKTEETINWVFDPAHSKIGFKVKHLMISSVFGNFKEFEGHVTTEGNNFTTGSISVSIKASSIDTETPDRDTHLRSADFLDVTRYPKILFESTGVKNLGDEKWELIGNLTVKGISIKVVMSVEYGGLITDPWGNVKAGFSLTGKVNRKDWGLNWNATLETGGVLVGDEIKIECDVELEKAK